MALALDGLRVIDADTHLTEAHDLWTKRAPAKYADRVPHVVEVDGKPMWYVDGAELGFAGARVVHRSWASVRCVSASMTRRPSRAIATCSSPLRVDGQPYGLGYGSAHRGDGGGG